MGYENVPTRLIGLSELREILGCCENTIRKLMREDRIPMPMNLTTTNKKWNSREITIWLDAGMPDNDTFDEVRNKYGLAQPQPWKVNRDGETVERT